MAEDPTEPMIGDVYRITEQDYRFGTGVLICRVTDVLRRLEFDAEPWWEIRALCRFGEGRPGQERRVYVRAAAVPESRRS